MLQAWPHLLKGEHVGGPQELVLVLIGGRGPVLLQSLRHLGLVGRAYHDCLPAKQQFTEKIIRTLFLIFFIFFFFYKI